MDFLPPEALGFICRFSYMFEHVLNGGRNMYRRRFVKEIRGRVFLDDNNDGVMNDTERPLKDIGIRLYASGNDEAAGGSDGEILIRREKLFAAAKTDENGEFRFLAPEGDYSVCLDIETLPPGKGVPGTDRFYRAAEEGKTDFAVRDIESVSVRGGPVSMNIGENLIINPILRDRDGGILSAKVDYRSEDGSLSFRSNVFRISPKSLQRTTSNVVLDAGKARLRVPVHIRPPEACPAEKVRLAGRLGMIDGHTEIGYLLHALYDRRKLPEDYRSRIPIKSGTGFVEDIKRYMERADADPKIVEASRQALGFSVPKLDRVYRSPGGFFSIHYTLSGSNAVAARSRDPEAVPPYIEQIARAFDNVRTFTCVSRGFRTPILEEGRDSYDVYVFDQKGKYGVTYSTKITSKRDTGVRVASSYICIDNSYSAEKGFEKSREDCMKVTAAHEFFHAVQYAYNIDSSGWWKEASATWNEDEVYTGVDDYLRYIPAYMSAPFKSLDESGYSGVIFAKFLSENYGGSGMIRRIWEIQSAGPGNSIAAIDRAIKERYPGRDIGTVFNQFSAYNVNPAQYYKEGALWKTSAAVQNTYSNFPVAVNYGHLDHLSSNYQLFNSNSPSAGGSIRITVDGTKGARWGFKLQNKKRRDKLYSMTEIVSGGNASRAVVTIKNFGEAYENVCLIPSNLEKERDGLTYSYTVEMVPAP
jgi:hypothetical protein